MTQGTNHSLLKALMFAGAFPLCAVPVFAESAVPAARIQPAAVPAEKGSSGENVVVSYSYVGVALDTMPAATFRENSRPGVQAVYVLKNSPADKAGIKSGDVLLSLDGQKLFFPNQFSALVRSYPPGSRIEIVLMRGGEQLSRTVTVGERRIVAPKRASAKDDVRIYINGRELSLTDSSQLGGWISLTPKGILIRNDWDVPEEFRRIVKRVHAKLPNSQEMFSSLRKQYEDARRAAVGKARQTFSQVFFGDGNSVIIVGDESGRQVTVSRAGDDDILFRGSCATQEEIDAIPEEAKKIIDSFTVLKPMPVVEKTPEEAASAAAE